MHATTSQTLLLMMRPEAGRSHYVQSPWQIDAIQLHATVNTEPWQHSNLIVSHCQWYACYDVCRQLADQLV